MERHTTHADQRVSTGKLLLFHRTSISLKRGLGVRSVTTGWRFLGDNPLSFSYDFSHKHGGDQGALVREGACTSIWLCGRRASSSVLGCSWAFFAPALRNRATTGRRGIGYAGKLLCFPYVLKKNVLGFQNHFVRRANAFRGNITEDPWVQARRQT